MAPVERLYQGTMYCIEDARDLATYTAQLKHIDLGKIERREGMDSVTVVIIIGESMRRDYMHCYGYPLPNTPKQDSLAKTGDLILFSDVVSSASWTVSSVSQSMSLYTREEEPKEHAKTAGAHPRVGRRGRPTDDHAVRNTGRTGPRPLPAPPPRRRRPVGERRRPHMGHHRRMGRQRRRLRSRCPQGDAGDRHREAQRPSMDRRRGPHPRGPHHRHPHLGHHPTRPTRTHAHAASTDGLRRLGRLAYQLKPTAERNRNP